MQRKHIYMLALLSRLDFCKEVMRRLYKAEARSEQNDAAGPKLYK
jgi:hypothetical protein